MKPDAPLAVETDFPESQIGVEFVWPGDAFTRSRQVFSEVN